MRIRLCPYCDSEMKKAHHCDVCNSFVWRPVYEDIHLNAESRGLGEEDCAYGELHDEKDHATGKTKSKVKRKKTEYASYTQVKTSTIQEKDTSGDKKSTDLKFGIGGVFIILVIIVDAVISLVGDESDTDPGEFLETFLQDEVSDGDTEYLDDDQLAELTDACTDYKHLDMTRDEAEQLVQEWYEENFDTEDVAYEIETEDYTYNYITHGSDGDTTGYYTFDSITIMTDSDYIMISVNYDTVTEQIHFISANGMNIADAQTLIDKILAKTGEIYGVDEGSLNLEEVFEEAGSPEEFEYSEEYEDMEIDVNILDEMIDDLSFTAE